MCLRLIHFKNLIETFSKTLHILLEVSVPHTLSDMNDPNATGRCRCRSYKKTRLIYKHYYERYYKYLISEIRRFTAKKYHNYYSKNDRG